MWFALSSSLILQMGCDGVFGLQHIAVDADDGVVALDDAGAVVSDHDARSGCLLDTFSSDTSGFGELWNREHSPPASEVAIESGRLSIKLDPTQHENALAWTNRAYDLTAATVTVRVDDVIGDGDAETYFELEADADNYYFMSYKNRGLLTAMGRNGVDQQTKNITFDPAQHRYWQLQHVPARNSIVVLTSGDGVTFTERHALTIVVPIDELFVDLGGVIYSGTVADGLSTFDDFELCLSP